MPDISARNFGYLIAYIVPGLVALTGLSLHVPMVKMWLVASATCESLPSVGGFLYLTLASVACGMTVSAVRFVLIDSLLWLCGLRRPRWNDASLEQNLHAKSSLIEHHYRYYQFHANMIIALLVAFVAHRIPPTAQL